MAKFEGTVSQVRKLDDREGDDEQSGLYSVSVEGVSLLWPAKNGQAPPEEGTLIRGVREVQWRKSKPPNQWLRQWEKAPIFS